MTPPTSPGDPRYVVLKFGGTSVSTRARWDTIAAQASAQQAAGKKPVIVCSATTGTTDLLLSLLALASRGDAAYEAKLADLRARHEALAHALDVDLEHVIGSELRDLERIAAGLALLQERTARIEARLVGLGEILSTKLGAAFLAKRGLRAEWLDARECLVSSHGDLRNERARVLSATIDDDRDPELAARLDARFAAGASCLVTQGFIASDTSGEPVLLGRGGSDTSASYFAAKLSAERCEIWTDVPGIFTADPRIVRGARLVRRVSFDEAQEIASAGAKVLHPRAIAPCRRHDIPIVIRWTDHPDKDGTEIARLDVPEAGVVKAVSHKRGVTLVAMETAGMWQAVGFLADVFACFKRHGLSVDLVSTSETNVTVSLDLSANALDDATLDALKADLAPLCRARIVRGCAAVSLVGQRIRAQLHRIGPLLRVFEERAVHLVSQASSDLNFTFVVDEPHAEALVQQLHAILFDEPTFRDDVLGPTFSELSGHAPPVRTSNRVPFWTERRDELLAIAAEGSPAYVYDVETLDAQLHALRSALPSVARFFYACKANPHPALLARIAEAGFGFECVSVGELERVLASCPGLSSDRLLYTPNFAPRTEVARGLSLAGNVTVDNVWMLETWGALFRGRQVLLRVDPGAGRGHHKHVQTAGTTSKFGMPASDLPRARAACEAHGVEVRGLHAHVGSGIFDAETWAQNAAFLGEMRALFPEARVLDVGGGLGIPERPGQEPLDLGAVEAALARAKTAVPDVSLWLEPGRFVVARAGALLTHVTQLKRKGERLYVGVDAGMSTLIRPALYGAYHEIVSLTRDGDPPAGLATVVGPICESGDVLGEHRALPVCNEGDVLLIGNAGAYGASMASEYNSRPLAREVVLPVRR